ncbi:MAG: flavodoxin domain-containing protein [Methanolinea sp.]|nr:flavodoxin domain-containing protein [Methanolinea sp.]
MEGFPMVTGTRGTGEGERAGGSPPVFPKRIVIAYASRYGSTAEIAEQIAGELRSLGYAVDCVSFRQGGIRLNEYDAAVLGSPLFLGKWLAEAREFVSRERAALGRMPVAVFSVGYTFRDPTPAALGAGEEAIQEICRMIPVRDRAFFPGKVDTGRMSPADRAVLSLAKVTPGDFRDEEMVRSYARRLPRVLGL